MDKHLIIPPTDLVQEWRAAASTVPVTLSTDRCGRRDYIDYIATRASQWGADQELEACVGWLDRIGYFDSAYDLGVARRPNRRPKPPSLKEQALTALARYTTGETILTNDSVETIRRALEQLDD